MAISTCFSGFGKERAVETNSWATWISYLYGGEPSRVDRTECQVGNWERSKFAELLMVSSSMLQIDKWRRKAYNLSMPMNR